jgi:hypothetical protein
MELASALGRYSLLSHCHEMTLSWTFLSFPSAVIIALQTVESSGLEIMEDTCSRCTAIFSERAVH